MSVAIPAHLEHLRRDRRGLPVPYINRWGAEDVSTLSLRHDEHVGRVAVFQDDSGQDKPDFTAQNMQRQRECMVAGLCQVCAKPVPWSRRFLVVADLSVETIRSGGREIPVVTEPWLCGLCATFAVEVCPSLIRRRRSEALVVVPVTSKKQVQAHLSLGWIDGPLREESLRVKPAMWAKIALLHRPITTTPARRTT